MTVAFRRTFASLRKHRNYRLFFTGQVVSLAGSWMQNIALAWLVIELSGSALAVGALAFTASDVSVARDRFVKHEFVNRAWGLPLYFGAQLLLAVTPSLTG